MIPPRLRERQSDPVADGLLPLLMLLSTTLTVVALHGATGPFLPAPAGLPWIALALGAEAFLFNTAFVVRHYDSATALRLLEGAAASVACKWLASLPYANGPMDALAGVVLPPGMWLWSMVLFGAWALGMWAAFQALPLHPAQLKIAQGQDLKKHNEHWEAFVGVRTRVLGELLVAALVTGLAGWNRTGVWGWSLPSVWLLVQAGVALAALMVANQLRQRVTWAQERLTVPAAIFDRWTAVAASLVLVPLLLALLLPVGPRIRLSAGGRPVEPPQVTAPVQTRTEAPLENWIAKVLAESPELPELLPPWVWKALVAFLYGGAGVLVLLLLGVALRQLRERATREELRGFKRLLLMLLEWYAALWQALWHSAGGVVGRALKGSAEVLGGVLGEAGVVGRFLPHPNRAPSDPRAAVRYFFARLQAEAGRRRLGRAPGATAGEFGQRLAAAAPERAGEVTELVDLYNRARYSEEPVPAQAATFARRAWVAIARALKR